MAQVLGLDAVLWIADSSGSGGIAGTYIEMTNARNVTLSLETAEADVTTRANSGWRATTPTLKDASVEFEMIYDTADAGFTEVQEAVRQIPGVAAATIRWPDPCGPASLRAECDAAIARRSAKETAKRASNESWTLKKRKELRAWKAERDALARRCKETKAAMEKKTKAYRREMDRYVEVKGEEDLKERMLSESLRRKPTSRAGDHA